MLKAECGNQAVDRLADRVSPLAQVPEVFRCGDGEFLAPRFKKMELAKFAQDARGSALPSHTLKNLAKNQIGQPKSLAPKLTIEVLGRAIFYSAQIVDPYGCIDDDHQFLLLNPSLSRLIEVPIPANLAAQPTNRRLPAGLNE